MIETAGHAPRQHPQQRPVGWAGVAAEGRGEFVAVVHRRGRPETLQAAEDRMADDVHQRDHPPAEPDLREDDACLRHRGVGEHALEIGLHAAHERGMQRRAAPDHDEQPACGRRGVEHRFTAEQHIGSGVNRQSAIENRARRRRALHRPRQPAGEGHLGALAEGGKHEEERDEQGGGPWHQARGVGPGAREQPLEVARAGRLMDDDARGKQPHVADPVGREGPQRRIDGVSSLVEESDQQRRRDPEKLPAREQHVDAAGEHHQVHPRPEEDEQDEEAGEAGLAMEVFAGEGVDERAEAGGKADVGHRQAVGHQFDRRGMMADGEQPAEVNHLSGEAPIGDHDERDEGRKEAGREGSGHDARGGPFRQGPPQQRGQADAHESRDGCDKLPDDERGDRIGEKGRHVHEGTESLLAGPDAPASSRAGGTLPRWPRYQAADDGTTGIDSDSGT